MPLKVSVGLSQKMGLPDYSSLGASCHVEYEADGQLLHHDLSAFHRQVQAVFGACRQAVQEELAREQVSTASSVTAMVAQPGHHAPPLRPPRKATASQLRALDAIADRLHMDLAAWLEERFGLQVPQDLTVKEASTAIDELNAVPSGTCGGLT